MEFHGRHTSLLSQHPNSSSAANEEGPNDTEIEMVADECTNGAADAEDAAHENMLLDSSKLGALKRREFFDNLVKCVEDDNLQFLQSQKDRIERQVFFVDSTKIISYISKYGSVHDGLCIVIHFDRVGVKLPSIEVTYENLCVQAESRNSRGNHLPTLWNSIKGVFSGLIMLFGVKSDKVKINILEDVSGIIQPCRLALLLGPPGCGKSTLLRALAGQLDKSLKVTGDISYNGYGLDEFVPEKTAAYISQYDLHIPDMTAIAIGAPKKSLQTDYILKIMGLDICADTMVGDVMSRGISGGQKKRLTTAEMIVGPAKAFFMDEISNGKIIYHGPRDKAHNFFEECGFRCPERKGMADFLQEVFSRKDQRQYWSGTDESYRYISSDKLSSMFKKYQKQRKREEASVSHQKSKLDKEYLSFNKYSLPKLELLKACGAREALLIKRNVFVYAFKTGQLSIVAVITMSVFFRTHMKTDLTHASYYMGALYYSILVIMINGIPEMSMQIARLPSFYKQKRYYFYPSWAYAIPASILKIPLSLLDAFVWICITYYGIGYTCTASRFFCQFLILSLLHQSVSTLYRFIASYAQTHIMSFFYQFVSLALFLVFGGFILSKSSMPGWLSWGFWISPLSYAQLSTTINEFLATRWQKETMQAKMIGTQTLINHGLYYSWYFYWISVGALLGYIILFYIAFGLALAYRKPIEIFHGSMPRKCFINGQQQDEETTNIQNNYDDDHVSMPQEAKMAMPTMQLSLTFQNLNYYVDTPPEMLKQGYPEKRLQLLNSVTGVFRPGVLSALMGVSGAGKTTLLDVLAGRKTGGYIEGDIRIGGYPKVQETLVRILGYCEQVDIHSPQLTVEESVAYSAWLRLPSNTDKETRYEFVDEVLKIVELHEIKDALVGSPGMNGLSLEQRKRLTVAIELVSNPSIILMDEPTTGLDARSAAIVIRAVKNISETGRTVVCTIHQPSIDIFEAFDELILMKNGGKIIYNGPIGKQSCKVVEYFENVIYWRSPQYNLNRMVVIVLIALIFGALYWQHAKILNNEQDLFNVLGAMYIGVIQLGVYNEYSIISFSTTERIVMYREKFSGMYSSWAYSFAQAAIEIPYVFIQALLYTFIIYPTIGYYWRAHKLLLFFYAIFCSVLSYTYVGLLFVSVTPTVQVATILGSFFNAMQTLFSGFLLPAPQMPNLWIWLYYLCPTSWILDALLTSQYGSIDKEVKAFGETKSVAAFLNDYYGFNQDRLSVVTAVITAFPIVLIILYSVSIEKLNFQKR
ncbi:unnamed protein product [Urochloa decumbens]|uniref:ABC transporter domain-containing protein n=1 Tax=Urochloa decumbens TaxID=240449 RepID=A0ABC8XEW2_9POAL